MPDPDLFVWMYARREAVLSSQIEGTQATFADLLEAEAGIENPDRPVDVIEARNYVAAMRHGLDRLVELPLSLRLIREVHEVLLKDARGGERTPGEFRKTQNWIGPAGSTISNAVFVPPAAAACLTT